MDGENNDDFHNKFLHKFGIVFAFSIFLRVEYYYITIDYRVFEYVLEISKILIF